jgi:hypothetical protein
MKPHRFSQNQSFQIFLFLQKTKLKMVAKTTQSANIIAVILKKMIDAQKRIKCANKPRFIPLARRRTYAAAG